MKWSNNRKKKWRGGTLTPPRALIACAAKNGLLGQRKIAGKGKKRETATKHANVIKHVHYMYVCVSTLCGQILEKVAFEYTIIDFWNRKNVFFIFAILWKVTLSQQLQVLTGHKIVYANSMNFGLLKNFLEVMKKEVNFEKVKEGPGVFYEI